MVPARLLPSPAKAGGHRALADILESVDELRYYRSVLFPAGDGPDSATARKAAAAVTAEPTALAVARHAERAATPGTASAAPADEDRAEA